MKKLTKDVQISTLSHPEILPGLEQITGQLAGEEIGYMTKKVTYGHILNGLVLLLLDHTEPERLEIARRAIRRLEDFTLEREPTGSKGFQTGHPLTQMPEPQREKQRRNGQNN